MSDRKLPEAERDELLAKIVAAAEQFPSPEPLDLTKRRWMVIRTWYMVEAETAVDAIEKSKKLPHDASNAQVVRLIGVDGEQRRP